MCLFQVLFNDGYEVMMLAKTHTCCFLERPPVTTHKTYSLEYVADVMEEPIARRLMYTKNAVLQMLGGPIPSISGG